MTCMSRSSGVEWKTLANAYWMEWRKEGRIVDIKEILRNQTRTLYKKARETEKDEKRERG